MGKDLGLRITETLQKRGMPQKELALRIGVTEAVVSRNIYPGIEILSRKLWQTLQPHSILRQIIYSVSKTKNLIAQEFAV